MARIYHSKNTRDSSFYPDADIFGRDDAIAAFCTTDQYELVALVDTDDLDLAYQLTNHIDQPWTQNSGVTALTDRPRSTMIGDIIINSDGAFVVAGVGFESLGRSDISKRVIASIDRRMTKDARS